MKRIHFSGGQRWPAVAVLLVALGLIASGCQPKQTESPAKAGGAVQKNDQRSVYRQAIDQAKGLEKQINDRAIDPGEKARLGGADPTGQDQ